MKKLLGIIVLGLLLSGNAYASCLDDVELTVTQPNSYLSVINFELLNNNNKSIEITEIRISTADNQTIKSYEPFNQILKPFEIIIMGLKDQKVYGQIGCY